MPRLPARITADDRRALYESSDDEPGCSHDRILHDGTPKRPIITCTICHATLFWDRGELVTKEST